MNMSKIIEIDGLVKRYKELVALDHFNREREEGEIFGLLGPNGSGKSTTISCILGLLKFDKGEVKVFGKPMEASSYESKKDIGVVLQNVAVFDELNVEENIDGKFVPKKLSGGLLRRLNIACGIAHKPKLIFMDEPTVAVDPQSRNKILDGIVELNKKGATIIYTSHYMEEIEELKKSIEALREETALLREENAVLKFQLKDSK